MYELDWIRTTYQSERELLGSVLKLYNESHPVDCDPCYSKGRVWEGLPSPLYKFDRVPQTYDTIESDCRSLPFPAESLMSLYFDPPFLVGKSKKGSIMGDRYTSFETFDELDAMYGSSLLEFSNILKTGGLLIVKCQDILHNHVFVPMHVHVITYAVSVGFNLSDILILINENIPLNPRVDKQIHARKTHSYYLIFHKNKPRLD